MTASRLLLFTLTALAAVGAIYFWALKMAIAAMGLLFVVLACLLVVFLLRRGRP